MNIIQTFLDLTKKTYPHGTEHLLEPFLPKNIQKDKFGNYFYVVGKDSRVIFSSHLDTVSGNYGDVIHTFDKDGRIVGTDGNTTLGADDKAGVTIMLNMIENKIPGLYYFFIGEEVGCVGSRKVSLEIDIFNSENYDKVISFDRRGNTSIITHQSRMRCCSQKFGEELCDQLNNHGLGMETDNTGVCTDSLEFIDTIPECTNISVGYLGEHTGKETQDLEFLERIGKACVEIDWEKLPVERDHKKTEYKTKKKKYNHNDNQSTYNGCGTNRSYMAPTKHNFPIMGNDRNFSSMVDRLDEEHERSIIDPYHDAVGYIKGIGSFINGRWCEDEENEDLDEATYGPFSDEYYDEYDEYDEEPDYENRINLFDHRNKYFDSISKITNDDNKKGYFDSIKEKYLDDRMTEEEIELIKDQMLDLDDPVDLAFSEDMERLINIKTYGSW